MIIQGEQSNTGTCDTPSLAGAGSWLIGIGISDEASATPTGPSGWGDPREINTAGDDFRYICWATKLTGAPAASYSITGGNPGFRIVAVIPEEGETLDDTIYVALRDNDAGASQTAASIGNVEADIRVAVAAFGNDSEFSISTPPEGWTQVGTVSGSPDTVSSAVFYRLDPEEDPIPGPTLVWSGSDAAANFTILVTGTEEGEEGEVVSESITEGAIAAEGFTTFELFLIDDEGARAGDSWTANVVSAGALYSETWGEGGVAGDTKSALAVAIASLSEGGVAGDTWLTSVALASPPVVSSARRRNPVKRFL